MKNKSKQLVSVIVTTKNEGLVIERLLKSIKNQTYHHLELIIVDNNSTDGTLNIAKRYTARTYLHGPERSAQRNFGARKSQGKYLLFLDADMELSPNVVEQCMKVAQDTKQIAAVVIPEQSVAVTFWEKVKAFERSFYNDKGDPVTDAARFFLRKVFFEVGGYDETITGPEDWDLPDTVRESGHEIGRVSAKILHYERAPSLPSLFKKKFYYGLYAHKYLTKHKIPVVSARTVYFLRPLFYKNWKRLLAHPLLTLALTTMLFVETLGGGLGYLVGRVKKQ